MEAIIGMVVLYLISTLFTKGKEKQEKQQKSQMPPFLNGKPSTSHVEPVPVEQTEQRSRPERPKMQVKSLEDFANEVFGQLQEKAEQKNQLPQSSIKQVTPQVEVETAVADKESTRVTKIARPELGAERTIIQRKKQKRTNVVIPKTRNQLVQAVVMSEVLGSPKAKQSSAYKNRM